jgi:single-stranded-DNA-specific exonuclease
LKKRWIYSKKKIEELKQDRRLTGISDIVLQILVNRGYTKPEQIESFLYGSMDNLHDTRLMADAEKAVAIIKESIEAGELMVNYSDYDSDGVNSAVVMTDLLRKAGGKVEFYTNNRFTQGYGMMPSGVDEILEKYPETKLIITTDNGIMAFDGVKRAIERGLKVVITDHHEQGDTLPDAHAVVDPKRKDCEYPFKGLCGAGVAFKLMMLLYWEMELPLETVYETLDIVALATVGDIVPLVDENRILVQEGLKLMRENKRDVFRIFQEVTGAKEITAHWTIGFVYVPMINAIGRLDGDPRRAIEMFFSEDEQEIKDSILYLKEKNEERKGMTETMCNRAEEIIAEKGLKKVIVVYDDSFHEGIVGLIAGRLKEKYNRPTFVFTKNHDGLLKGSARSIDNFHLKDSFNRAKEHMVGGGGHAKAAGLSIRLDQLEGFEKAMNDIADEWLTDDDFIKKYHVDSTLNANTIDISVVDDLKELEPFGESFPKPILVLDNFKAKKPFYMGDEKQHVKLLHDNISLIMWRESERYKAMGEPLEVKAIGFPELNIFRGNVSLQFNVDGDNYLKVQPSVPVTGAVK